MVGKVCVSRTRAAHVWMHPSTQQMPRKESQTNARCFFLGLLKQRCQSVRFDRYSRYTQDEDLTLSIIVFTLSYLFSAQRIRINIVQVDGHAGILASFTEAHKRARLPLEVLRYVGFWHGHKDYWDLG
jgi:hypothetical protein